MKLKTTNINPLSGFALPDRQTQIDKCVAKSRMPCPKIVESFMMENIHTGKRHSLFGMPFNFRSEDYKRVHLGFVFESPEGTTYGTRQPTKELLEAKHKEYQDTNAANFRAILNEMDDAQLEAQFRYWEAQP